MPRSLRRLFPAAEAALYAAFIALDFTGRTAASVPVKYAALLLCLLYALPAARTRDGRLAAAALALTAAADWFLLVRDAHYGAGVLLFCVVQTLYAVRLIRWRGRVCRTLAAVRLAPLALFALPLPRLDALALVYFTSLVCNAAAAARLAGADCQRRRFAAGLGLFVCCDLCVGAFNLGLLTGFTRYGMWLFYLPSQVLLALAAYPDE